MPHEIARLTVERANQAATKRVLDDDKVAELAKGGRRAPEANLAADDERRIVESHCRTARDRTRRRRLIDVLSVHTSTRRGSEGNAHSHLVPIRRAHRRTADRDELSEAAWLSGKGRAKHHLSTKSTRCIRVDLKARIRSIVVAKHNAGRGRAVQAHFDTNVIQVAQILRHWHILNHAELIAARRRAL